MEKEVTEINWLINYSLVVVSIPKVRQPDLPEMAGEQQLIGLLIGLSGYIVPLQITECLNGLHEQKVTENIKLSRVL